MRNGETWSRLYDHLPDPDTDSTRIPADIIYDGKWNPPAMLSLPAPCGTGVAPRFPHLCQPVAKRL
jgi:hypothetical protein